MEIIAAIPIVCWLCALIAMPRPMPGANATEERIVANRLGRQRRLTGVALVATVILFLVMIAHPPYESDPNLLALRDAQRICTNVAVGFPTCYQHRADGSWWREEWVDGAWLVIGTAPAPPPGMDIIRDTFDAPH